MPVTKGQTVLEAAQAVGIEIPHFCWHRHLVPVGACRICLVEIEKFPKLQPACATVAGEGMVVHTDSPQVIKARQGVLEFLLANHPLDCPTCDQGGECELQDVAFKYGLDYSRHQEPKHRFLVGPESTFDDLRIGPEIIRSQNRCIHCYRCVRLVNEAFMEDDLGAYQRGCHTEIKPPPGGEIRNLYSGNLVQNCPVGALTSSDWRYQVRVWLTKQAQVICPHCPDGCNLKLWTYHNRILRATAAGNDFVNDGFICDVGRYGYQFATSPDRIKQPMIRKAGELVEATWTEALEYIKSQTNTLKSKLSGSGFFGLVGESSTNEEIYAFGRLLRRVIGTNNIDHRLGRKRKLSLGRQVVERGIGSDTIEYADIEKADVILVIGSDLHAENPITALRVKKAIRQHGARLILANPRPTPLGIRAAQVEVIYKPATEVMFLLGLIAALISEAGKKPEAIDLEASPIEEFRSKHESSGQAAAICGVAAATLEKIAATLSNAENIVILTGREVEQHPYRDSIYLAIGNLQSLCRSACFAPMPTDSNSRGASLFGAEPDLLPGGVSVDDKAGYEDTWKGPISEMVGKDTIGILDAIAEDEIECGFIFNTDPIRVFPDGNQVKSILEGLKLLVVIDSFMNDTARIADVILPLSSSLETEGTVVNWEGRLQYSQAAIAPLFESKPGCEIIELLADHLGVKFNQPTPTDVYREMIQFLNGEMPAQTQAIGREGVLIKSTEKKAVPDLADIKYTPYSEDNQYPFVLLVGNADHHRGTLSEKNDSLMKFTSEPFVGINAAEADKLIVANGDLVRVESRYGKVVGKVTILKGFADGQVLVPDNFIELCPNLLMGRQEKVDLVKLTKM